MATHIHIDMGVGSQRDSSSSTAAKTAVSTTYSELKALRDSGKLVPGAWYRITDYECTTSQADTMSAGNQFDIIVLALDESHLSEDAFAAHHGTAAAAEENEEQNNQNVQPAEPGEVDVEGEGGRARSVDYFANNKLVAWRLKYCLDNDTDRFAWACDGQDKFYIEFVGKETVRLYRTAIIEDGTVWQFGEGKETFYTAADPEVGDNIYEDSTLQSSFTQITAAGAVEGIDGKGVIYRMIDEFGNDCPYDFKNIMFKRFEITAVNTPQGVDDPNHFLLGAWGLPTDAITVDPETSEWFYTFSSVNSGTVSDASLAFDYNDSNEQGIGASLNVMKAMQETTFKLNNNVFINDDGDLCCVGNVFERNCPNNTLANGCNYNKFLDYCRYNQFSQNCSGNQFSQNCRNNQFSQECSYNQFSQGCWYNQFSQSCSGNQFSQDCWNNQFSQDCCNNQFSQDCSDNQFSQSCSENQFSQYCSRNQFSQNCWYNQFSQGCYANQFSQNCAYNQFSQNCQYVVLPQDSQYFRLLPNVRYCTIQATGATGAPKNVQILSGVFGTDSTPLTITIEKNKDYTQMVGKNTSGTLKIWNPADLAS